MVAAILAGFTATNSNAEVLISNKPTNNMVCSGGICAPTASDAVINVTDLENLLASGNVTVTTTGSDVQAKNIHVSAAFSWSTASVLTLDAYQSIVSDKPVSVLGTGGVAIQTNNGGKDGTLTFGPNGHVAFANLSSPLVINSATYTLVGDIVTLANNVFEFPNGDFAIANPIDAKGSPFDGPAIPYPVKGIVEGLGNRISHLAIMKSGSTGKALFAEVESTGTVENLGLDHAKISGVDGVAGFAVTNYGQLFRDFVNGDISMISRSYDWVGGLVGENYGAIADCYTTGTVSVGEHGHAGGLVGDNAGGSISNSFSLATVTGQRNASVGGLVGESDAAIGDSYSTGAVSAGIRAFAGGLVGQQTPGGTISDSYSTGAVTGGSRTLVGGLVGYDGANAGSIADAYWDTDTSGITNPAQGAGNIANDPGITGLTTIQLQSGLPQGFDPAVWHESATVNGGLPYLLANPPPK